MTAVTVRMGSNKNQDICIEYFLTTYLQGEVAGGHAGGGTNTIGFLLEKEGGYRLLALLIDKDGDLGRNGKVRANQNAGR